MVCVKLIHNIIKKNIIYIINKIPQSDYRDISLYYHNLHNYHNYHNSPLDRSDFHNGTFGNFAHFVKSGYFVHCGKYPGKPPQPTPGRRHTL